MTLMVCKLYVRSWVENHLSGPERCTAPAWVCSRGQWGACTEPPWLLAKPRRFWRRNWHSPGPALAPLLWLCQGVQLNLAGASSLGASLTCLFLAQGCWEEPRRPVTQLASPLCGSHHFPPLAVWPFYCSVNT